MQMLSPTATALTTAAMMVAMMLPSFAPTLWHYHRHARGAFHHAILFAIGYAAVWTTLGLAMSALPTSTLAPWLAGAIVMIAGTLQCSRWKARQLLRCHHTCVTALPAPKNLMASLLEGFQLGVHCISSCAAPMAVLFVAGLMDRRMMLLITAAITAERVAPRGIRIARLTGAAALIAGFVVYVRA